jgi:hypothetical protein
MNPGRSMSHSPHEEEPALPVIINNVQLPQEDVEYLGLHLERRLTWRKHRVAKGND